jgi:hypothetical protein
VKVSLEFSAPFELSVSLSPVPLPADEPADVTIEIVFRNTGRVPVLVFPDGAGFHDGFGERGPRFEVLGMRFPEINWHSGKRAKDAAWFAARARRLQRGEVATRSIAACWIPRRFVSPESTTSWLSFDRSAKWARQFRGRAPETKLPKTTWIELDRPGLHDLRFEYIHLESDVDLLGLEASMRVISGPIDLEIP